MALYLKKLRNIEELEEEKRKLILEKRLLEDEGLLSLDNLLGKGSEGGGEGGSPVLSLFSAVLPSGLFVLAGPVIGLVSRIVMRRFKGAAGESPDDESVGKTMLKSVLAKGVHALGSTAKEVVGGYLKWKAVELSYEGITLIVRKQKKKKAQRKAEKEAAESHLSTD